MELDAVPVEITSGSTVYKHVLERSHDYYVPAQFFHSRPPEHMWRRCPSKDHAGKVYYANKSSGRSEWSLPDITSPQPAPSAAPSSTASPMIGKLDEGQVSSARLSIQDSIRQRLLARMGKDQQQGGTAIASVAPSVTADLEATSPAASIVPAEDVKGSAGGGTGVRDRIAAWRAGRGSSAGRPTTPQAKGGPASPAETISPTKGTGTSGINLAAVESDAAPAAAFAAQVPAKSNTAQLTTPQAARPREVTPVSGKLTPSVAYPVVVPAEVLGESIARDVYEEKRRQMLEADEAIRLEKEAALRAERANQERIRLLSQQRLSEEEAYARLVESRRAMEQRRVELEARQVESAVGALGRAQEAEMLREAASTIDHYHQAQEQIRLAAEAEKARAVSFSEAIARSLLAAANDSPAEAASPSSLPAKGKSHHAAVGALSAHHDEPPRASDAELLSLQAALAPPAAPTGLPQRKPTTVVYGPALTYIGEVTVSSRGSAAALKHGRGQMFYDASRTTFYDGQWADDEKSGFGTMSLPHSLVEGEWRRNKLHGRSTLQTSKLKASLQLQQGQPSGNILAELDTGSTFAGRVVPAGDRPQAVFGTLRLTSADTAEWMWQDPRAPGTGDAKVHFASGDSYVGAVQGYVLHGHGAYHFTEGHEYIGEFHRGAMTGRGVFRFQSGNVYEGTLRGGVFHGTGKYSQQQEYVYEGEWVEGRMHGRGVVKYRNGDVWEGVLENDKRVKGRYVSSRVFQLPPS